jgi:hypothetical protein
MAHSEDPELVRALALTGLFLVRELRVRAELAMGSTPDGA